MPPGRRAGDTITLQDGDAAVNRTPLDERSVLRLERAHPRGCGSKEDSMAHDRDGSITLFVVNEGAREVTFRIYDAYTRQTLRQTINEGRSHFWHWDLDRSHGWYDLTVTVESDSVFLQRLAGHVETGKDSTSDPAFGA
jgi:phospholipase C